MKSPKRPTQNCLRWLYFKAKVFVQIHIHNHNNPNILFGGSGSSVGERATPGEEVLGSIPAVAASSLLVGSVSV